MNACSCSSPKLCRFCYALSQIVAKAKYRAKSRGLPCTIDSQIVSDLYKLQAGKCAISGERLTFLYQAGNQTTNASLDRIDSSRGYLPDNIQLVCKTVNMMKGEMSEDELFLWCSKLILNLTKNRSEAESKLKESLYENQKTKTSHEEANQTLH